MTEENQNEEQNFAVYAEVKGIEKPLILTDLTFARLMDDVVVPYQSKEPFFVDGAPVKSGDLTRIKILLQKPVLTRAISDFHFHMRTANRELQRMYADQYHVRLEALLRESAEDVTSQVIKAYDSTIKPYLKRYLPKREELIQAACHVFFQAVEVLG